MIRSGLILMIKESATKGKSAYAISKEIGVSENTARKYMTQPARPHGLTGTKKGSKLDPYKPYLHELMDSGIYNCVVLYGYLQEKGYDGGMSILKEYVHPFRPPRRTPAVQRFETVSGKQAQMDWGICQYTDPEGHIHKVPAFVMILGHSRAKYVEFTTRCDLHSLERCIVNLLYIDEIARFFDVSPTYLLRGEEDEETMKLSQNEEKLIQMYRYLHPESKEKLMATAEVLVNLGRSNTNKNQKEKSGE